jgi:hypothetical protein
MAFRPCANYLTVEIPSFPRMRPTARHWRRRRTRANPRLPRSVPLRRESDVPVRSSVVVDRDAIIEAVNDSGQGALRNAQPRPVGTFRQSHPLKHPHDSAPARPSAREIQRPRDSAPARFSAREIQRPFHSPPVRRHAMLGSTRIDSVPCWLRPAPAWLRAGSAPRRSHSGAAIVCGRS